MSPLISGQKENFHIISAISLTSRVGRNHALENSVCVVGGEGARNGEKSEL